MGASLTMIDRHYGHLARDGREHVIRLLDSHADIRAADVHGMDARWTRRRPSSPGTTTETPRERQERKACGVRKVGSGDEAVFVDESAEAVATLDIRRGWSEAEHRRARLWRCKVQ